jgi:hypothetical protein
LDQSYEHEEILQRGTEGDNIQHTIRRKEGRKERRKEGRKEGRKERRWKEGRLTVLVIACIGTAF